MAVKFTVVDEQIEVAEATIDTDGAVLELSVMVTLLEVAVADAAVVNTQVITSLFARVVLV